MATETVRSFWVEGPITRHQLLTMNSFVRHGHDFELFTYGAIEGIPSFVTVRDLEDVVPHKEVYFYKHLGHAKRLGGISERIKAELLYRFGGWHVDMDVTCLKPFDLTDEYVLRPHVQLVVANIIKCPPVSSLARIYRDWTLTIDENNTEWEASFVGLAKGVRELSLEGNIVSDDVFGRDDDGDWLRLTQSCGGRPGEGRYAIHWCRSRGDEVNVEAGSYYDELLKEYNLS